MRTIIIFVLIAYSITMLKNTMDLKAELITEKKETIEYTEKYLLSLRLNYLYDSIANEYQSSRRGKENCKECLIITTKLN